MTQEIILSDDKYSQKLELRAVMDRYENMLDLKTINELSIKALNGDADTLATLEQIRMISQREYIYD